MTKPLARQYRWHWPLRVMVWRARVKLGDLGWWLRRCPTREWNWCATLVYGMILAWIVWLVGRVGEWIVK